MSRHVTVRQAIQAVADHPVPRTDDMLDLPVHEIICRTLFDVANKPNATERGALNRANKARAMILDRLVGKRRAGSHPATRTKARVELVDLTAGAIE